MNRIDTNIANGIYYDDEAVEGCESIAKMSRHLTDGRDLKPYWFVQTLEPEQLAVGIIRKNEVYTDKSWWSWW